MISSTSKNELVDWWCLLLQSTILKNEFRDFTTQYQEKVEKSKSIVYHKQRAPATEATYARIQAIPK
ncbi:hypothetical protein CIHG_00969 [Coccidioides immitis H538.4]|uniref:Uncharacterized protein n=1 Tax=Coccidioides immitis H538.4 TaxID=396776 RepID=A0A0J8RE29_COCIT|nr:hypothetical protein CIHG_00969 [Coccidioides immitis H538.4]